MAELPKDMIFHYHSDDGITIKVDAIPLVRCGECAHCYAEGFAHERNICEKHPELGNVPDDWFCADGERKEQDDE
jgi:hypothetical protein